MHMNICSSCSYMQTVKQSFK